MSPWPPACLPHVPFCTDMFQPPPLHTHKQRAHSHTTITVGHCPPPTLSASASAPAAAARVSSAFCSPLAATALALCVADSQDSPSPRADSSDTRLVMLLNLCGVWWGWQRKIRQGKQGLRQSNWQLQAWPQRVQSTMAPCWPSCLTCKHKALQPGGGSTGPAPAPLHLSSLLTLGCRKLRLAGQQARSQYESRCCTLTLPPSAPPPHCPAAVRAPPLTAHPARAHETDAACAPGPAAHPGRSTVRQTLLSQQ
jgi:hypothetical protein